MLNLIDGKNTKDEKFIFYDGILTIIHYRGATPLVSVICLNAEYDNPMSLADIAKNFPHVFTLIYEDSRKGFVFHYGNHPKDDEKWELVGTTVGYM